MKKLNDNELIKIEGGGAITTGIGISLIVSSVIVFLSGIVRGYTNPEACNVK